VNRLKRQKKIVAYLCGGLGNQLFIYAAARTLADLTGRTLILTVDAFPYDYVYRRTFELGGFNIRYDEILPVAPKWRYWLKMKWNGIACKLGLGYCIKERRNYWFDEHFFAQRSAPTIEIWGYFQSERYFEANRHVIWTDLAFQNTTAFECELEYKQIVQAEKSVFVHIRSYKDIPGKQDGSAALPIDYYSKALNAMQERVGSFTAFVFSDDVAWAQQRLTVPTSINTHFVRPSGKGVTFDQMRDFYLMQCCQHGIVANSSFSWWAAWLGEKRWIAQGFPSVILRPLLHNQPDFYPVHWEAIAYNT